MKKLIHILSIICIGSSFIACGSGNNDISDNDTNHNNISHDKTSPNHHNIEISKIDDKLKITWTRSGEVKKGSYTQLEIKNAAGNFKIASVNTNDKIDIVCDDRGTYLYKNMYVNDFICKASNVPYGVIAKIPKTGVSVIQEKGGVDEIDSTLQLIKLNNVTKNIINPSEDKTDNSNVYPEKPEETSSIEHTLSNFCTLFIGGKLASLVIGNSHSHTCSFGNNRPSEQQLFLWNMTCRDLGLEPKDAYISFMCTGTI